MAISRRGKGGIAATAVVTTLVAAVISLFVAQPKPGLKEIPYTKKIRYQETMMDSRHWDPPRKLKGEMHELRNLLERHVGESFRIKMLGSDDWSRVRNLSNTLQALHKHLSAEARGHIWIVQALQDGYTLKVRKVDLDPAVWTQVADGTFSIDVIVGTMRLRHPDVHVIGVYACRTIAGSSQLSQHAFGNAVDVSGSYQAMNSLAWDFYSLTRAGYLPISQILWNHENLLSGGYVYDHTNHVHISGSPLLSGSCRRP